MIIRDFIKREHNKAKIKRDIEDKMIFQAFLLKYPLLFDIAIDIFSEYEDYREFVHSKELGNETLNIFFFWNNDIKLSKYEKMLFTKQFQYVFEKWEVSVDLIDLYTKKHGGIHYPKSFRDFKENYLFDGYDQFEMLIQLINGKINSLDSLIRKACISRVHRLAFLDFKDKLYNLVEDEKITSRMLVSVYEKKMAKTEDGERYLQIAISEIGDIPDDPAKIVESERRKVRLHLFEESLVSMNAQNEPNIDIDSMNHLEFEKFVAKIFEKLGYTTELTATTGDQGIDIIARRGNEKWAIQVKHYKDPVGNDAIQEVLAGKLFRDCTHAAVVTNSKFTRSAKELASKTGVILWNRQWIENYV